MGRNDWQQAIENEDFTAVIAPARPGRGWRAAAALLLVALGVFALGYYVPLYRAHASLSDHYRRLGNEAKTQRAQLLDTIATLKAVSGERDRLVEPAQRQHEGDLVRQQRLDRLEGSLEVALKRFMGKGLSLERADGKLVITLSAPVMIGLGTADVTAFAKRALCALAGPVKTAGATVSVAGLGVTVQPRGQFSFSLAAARAANVARQLSDGCGIAPSQLGLAVVQSLDTPGHGVRLVLEPGT